MDKENIQSFLNTMMDKISEENFNLYKNIIETAKLNKFDGPDEFNLFILYPWRNFIDEYLNANVSSNREVIFIYKNYNLIESHISHLIEKFEGRACSADKSRTIINSIIKFFEKGKEIEFNYNQEYTFHLPKRILNTHEEIIEMYKGIKDLLYGDPDKYLIAFSKIIKKIEDE